ncbi:hypothetical protein [Xanthomonas campestris]|uniref:hypothetical protein n=1 Tax=Xanthomonas campestris TaxID=339 RepID=UPI003CF19A3F
MKEHWKLLLALTLIFSSTSCATDGVATATKERAIMSESNQITPNELGKRFLVLIKNTDGVDTLSPTVVQTSMGVTFQADEDKKSGFYTSKVPGGDWQYSMIYNLHESSSAQSSIALELIQSNPSADASTLPCELKLEDFQRSLVDMGSSPAPTSHNEIGLVVDYSYTRRNLLVRINPYQKGTEASGEKATGCVERISAHRFED